MRRLIARSALLIAASAAAPAIAGPQNWQEYGPGTGVIRCESNDDRVRECPTSGGRVVLERQHSRAACIEGRSWGYGRNGIWVSQGCRADFRIGGYDGNYGGGNYGHNYGNNYGNNYGGSHNGQTFRCESNDNRMKRCSAGTSGRVQLVRQLSRAACIEGRTWGSDYNGVWVSQVAVPNSPVRSWHWLRVRQQGNSYDGGRLFRCESNDGAPANAASTLVQACSWSANFPMLPASRAAPGAMAAMRSGCRRAAGRSSAVTESAPLPQCPPAGAVRRRFRVCVSGDR